MGVMVSPVAGGDLARALRLLLVVVDNVDKLEDMLMMMKL